MPGCSAAKLFFMAERAFSGIYCREDIKKTLDMFIKRFFTQQFKRNAVPDGIQINSAALSPRGVWNMPSEVSYDAFMKDTEESK